MMKKYFYAAFNILLMVFSVDVNSQNKHIEIQVLNDTIYEGETCVLKVLIINNSNVNYILPINTSSITSYEKTPYIDSVLVFTNEIEQLKLSVRVRDKDSILYEHTPSSLYLDEDLPQSYPILFYLKVGEEIKNTIIKTYRKDGFTESDDWIMNYHYFRSHLITISSKSFVEINYIFNISEIKGEMNDGSYMSFLKINDYFKIKDKESTAQFELDLQPDYLSSYILKTKEKVLDEFEIWDQKLVSNSVIIKPK